MNGIDSDRQLVFILHEQSQKSIDILKTLNIKSYFCSGFEYKSMAPPFEKSCS